MHAFPPSSTLAGVCRSGFPAPAPIYQVACERRNWLEVDDGYIRAVSVPDAWARVDSVAVG